MPAKLGQEPDNFGRHGRLSPDYIQASLSVALDTPSPPPVSRQPAAGAAGQLTIDYQAAVADVVSNPSALFRLVLDEHFDTDESGWPTDPQAEIRRVEGGYRVLPVIGDHRLAIGAPVGSMLRNVLVGARFRKLAGPAGGTYGLLLRDGGPGPRDGRNQTGRYYVAQVDDQGLVGIWRRDPDRWFELAGWTPCAAVRPGIATNEVSFEVVGGHLTLIVNGHTAVSTNDAVLDRGGVGLVVGGAGNAMIVERFVVQALS